MDFEKKKKIVFFIEMKEAKITCRREGTMDLLCGGN